MAEHKLGEEISGGSLSETSFARAMVLSKGTVSVVDPHGVSWSRSWCGECGLKSCWFSLDLELVTVYRLRVLCID